MEEEYFKKFAGGGNLIPKYGWGSAIQGLLKTAVKGVPGAMSKVSEKMPSAKEVSKKILIKSLQTAKKHPIPTLLVTGAAVPASLKLAINAEKWANESKDLNSYTVDISKLDKNQKKSIQSDLNSFGYKVPIDGNLTQDQINAYSKILNSNDYYGNNESWVQKLPIIKQTTGHIRNNLQKLDPIGYAEQGTMYTDPMGGFASKIKQLVTGNTSELAKLSHKIAAEEDPKKLREYSEQYWKLIEEKERATNGGRLGRNKAVKTRYGGSPEYLQQRLRYREDMNSLYNGRPQRYHSFMYNPDYNSPTAKSKGLRTWIYTDPSMRSMQRDWAKAYINDEKNNGNFHNSDDPSVLAAPVRGDANYTWNNYTIAKSKNNQGEGRWGDSWDFLIDKPIKINDVIVGDTVYNKKPHAIGKVESKNDADRKLGTTVINNQLNTKFGIKDPTVGEWIVDFIQKHF